MRSKKAAYNVLTSLILQFITIIYGFIIPRIIISNFGSNVNGLASSITQFLAYITLLESGVGPVVKSLLYKPIAKKNTNEIENILYASENFFRKISKIFIIYIILLIIFYPMLIGNNFSFAFTASLIIIISISQFAEYYFGMTYRLFLQADQKTYIISIIQILTYILSIFAIIICVKVGCSIQIIKLVSGLIFILRPILQNLYVKKKYHINFENIDKSYKLKNKWEGLIQHIAFTIHVNTDITLLTIFRPIYEVSIYAIYNMIVGSIKSIVEIFSNSVSSSFGDMIAKDEKVNLNNKFGTYETFYFMLSTIFYTCTIILLVPFIFIYTKGVTDANYIQYTFSILIVLSWYLFSIRSPYNELAKAGGRFKETRNGAMIEAICNIVVSLMLIKKLGLSGVAIGTITAMFVRTCDLIYQTNKYILNRTIWVSIKKIILVIIETLIIVTISKFLPMLDNVNYINWIINAIVVGVVAVIVVAILNSIFYKKEINELFDIFKRLFRRRKIISE